MTSISVHPKRKVDEENERRLAIRSLDVQDDDDAIRRITEHRLFDRCEEAFHRDITREMIDADSSVETVDKLIQLGLRVDKDTAKRVVRRALRENQACCLCRESDDFVIRLLDFCPRNELASYETCNFLALALREGTPHHISTELLEALRVHCNNELHYTSGEALVRDFNRDLKPFPVFIDGTDVSDRVDEIFLQHKDLVEAPLLEAMLCYLRDRKPDFGFVWSWLQPAEGYGHLLEAVRDYVPEITDDLITAAYEYDETETSALRSAHLDLVDSLKACCS